MNPRSAMLRRVILRDHGHFGRLAIALALVACAAVLRVAIDGGANGVPFTTFYPAITIGALVLDWRYGTLVAALSALAANRLFMGEMWFARFDLARLVIFGLFAFSAGMLIAVGALVRRLLVEVDGLVDQQQAFNRELQHRIKNSLAIVQALASQGVRASDPQAFVADLSGRLKALAKANDLLSIGSEGDSRLPELAASTVEPFNGSGRIRLSGESCVVPKDSCVPLVMALHELCTNALKHGALSDESGQVELSWRFEGEGPHRALHLAWRESGGPPVVPPQRRGLGSRLLVAQGGIDAVDVSFAPDGLTCAMRIDRVSRARAPSI